MKALDGKTRIMQDKQNPVIAQMIRSGVSDDPPPAESAASSPEATAPSRRSACSFGFFCPSGCNGGYCSQSPSKVNAQLTLCQVTTDEVDAATKLLDKACQKLRGIQTSHPRL